MQKNRPIFILLNVLVVLTLGYLVFQAVQQIPPQGLTWTEAKDKIRGGDVEQVVFEGHRVQLQMKQGDNPSPIPAEYVERVEADEPNFVKLLDEHLAAIAARSPSA